MELWNKGEESKVAEISNSELIGLSLMFNKFIEFRKIRINPSSRFKLYEKYLNKKANQEQLQEKEIISLEYAYYDLMQVALIISQLNSQEEYLTEKLELLLKDNISIDANQNTNGRDTQFELFVLSCIPFIGFRAKLGIPPYPDIVTDFENWQFGIEVKRIKSLLQLKSRIKKADQQIKRVKDGGIVVTDFSFLFQIGKVKEVKSVNEALQDLEQRLYRLMSNNIEEVRKSVNTNRTFCWFGYAQKLYFIENGISIVYQWKNFNLCKENDARWLRVSSNFHKILEPFNSIKLQI